MKKSFFVVAVSLSVASLLAGCSSSNSGPSGMHKVNWYEKHNTARTKEIKWCNNNTPRQTLAACQNAIQAENLQANKNALAAMDSGGPMTSKSPPITDYSLSGYGAKH